jgi:hypothetical protein
MAVNGHQIAFCNESLEVEPHLRVFTGEPLHEIDERPRAIARHWIVLLRLGNETAADPDLAHQADHVVEQVFFDDLPILPASHGTEIYFE